MDSQAAKDDEAARSLVKEGKKQQAMLALRKKKQHEQLVVDCQNHQNRLEELIENIEISRIQKETVEALAEGVKMLKKIQKETGSVDYINQLMDDRDEALMQQQEISDALASAGVAADDPDALAEYERLVAAQAASQLASTTPAVPTPETSTAATEMGTAPVRQEPAEAAPAKVAGAPPARAAEAA
jgi:charged multivesicular body protein 6